MATARTPIYELPFPRPSDPVNVAGDIEILSKRIEAIFPTFQAANLKITCKNEGQDSLIIGDPVFMIGYVGRDDIGDIVSVAKSKSSLITTMPAVGIASSNMAPGAFGEIIINGVLEPQLNTSIYNVGDFLYVAPQGGLIKVQPEYPDYSQQVAVVLRSNSSQGKIAFIPGNSSGPTTWGQLKYKS
jgi:hypothetical protein